MNIIAKSLIVFSGFVSLASALPNYYNYVIIKLPSSTTINTSVITCKGTSGDNYLLESDGTLLLRDHIGSDAMVSITRNADNIDNTVCIIANPENLVNSTQLSSLVRTELGWLAQNNIIALTNNEIDDAVSVIMNEKSKGGAVVYYLINNSAETIVGGGGGIDYKIPAASLVLAETAVHMSKVNVNKSDMKINMNGSKISLSVPNNFIGKTVKYSIYRLNGNLVNLTRAEVMTSEILLKKNILPCPGTYILCLEQGSHTTAFKFTANNRY